MSVAEPVMMRARHRAFLRDLRRLAAAPPAAPDTRAAWERFRTFLRLHHEAERTELWPVLWDRADERPVLVLLLEQAERERVGLVARMDAVEAALTSGRTLRPQVERLAAALAAHHRTEAALARDAASLFGSRERCDLEWEPRRLLGIHGAADYYPWLLDGAPEDLRHEVLALLDPPDRLLYRLRWRARYERQVQAAA